MSNYKYETIAVGGTFDRIHRGHRELLNRAFKTGRLVVIGLASDEFVSSSSKKQIENDFGTRRRDLIEYLRNAYPSRAFEITKLERNFGPGMFTQEIEAIVVSEETASKVSEANAKRRLLGLKDLKVEIVPLILGEDGKRISSTRIRKKEIDVEGRVL